MPVVGTVINDTKPSRISNQPASISRSGRDTLVIPHPRSPKDRIMQEHTARENRKNEKLRSSPCWKCRPLCSVIFLALAGSTRAQQNDNTNNLLLPLKAKARLGTLRFGHIDSGVSALAFSHFSCVLGRSGFISIWERKQETSCVGSVISAKTSRCPLVFSGDGKFLVVKIGSCGRWPPESKSRLRCAANAQSYAISVAPDGNSVATAMATSFCARWI